MIDKLTLKCPLTLLTLRTCVSSLAQLYRYKSHFGTRVNEELWCDTGFGSGDHSLPEDFLATPYNLTESELFAKGELILLHNNLATFQRHLTK